MSFCRSPHSLRRHQNYRQWEPKLHFPYTGSVMDRVRFGRALGYGARHAAKTLLQAADAARAPAPSPAAPANSTPNAPTPPAQPQTTSPARPQLKPSVRPSSGEAKRLGRSLWSPLAKFSSIVWLQVTGVLFAFMAVFLFQGVWQQRSARLLPPGSHPAQKFYLLCAATLAFAYFAVSNFVRAARKDRR